SGSSRSPAPGSFEPSPKSLKWTALPTWRGRAVKELSRYAPSPGFAGYSPDLAGESRETAVQVRPLPPRRLGPPRPGRGEQRTGCPDPPPPPAARATPPTWPGRAGNRLSRYAPSPGFAGYSPDLAGESRETALRGILPPAGPIRAWPAARRRTGRTWA